MWLTVVALCMSFSSGCPVQPWVLRQTIPLLHRQPMQNSPCSLAILVCPEHSLPTPGGGLAGGSASPGSGVPVLTAGSVVWSHGKRQQPGIKSPA